MADWDSALLVEEPLPALPTSTERNQCTEVLSTLMLFGQAEVVWQDAIRLFKTRREHHIQKATWGRVRAEYQRLLAQGSSGGTMSDAPKRLRTDSGAQTPPSPSGLPSGAPASRGQRVPEGHGQLPGPPPPTSSNQPAGPPPPTGAYGGVNVDPNQPANPLVLLLDLLLPLVAVLPEFLLLLLTILVYLLEMSVDQLAGLQVLSLEFVWFRERPWSSLMTSMTWPLGVRTSSPLANWQRRRTPMRSYC